VVKESRFSGVEMKTRILFVIDNLQFGGGERVFAQIINGLPSDKYETFLASQPGEQFDQALQSSQFQFFPIDFSKRLSFSLVLKLADIIKKNSVDMVHGQGARVEFYARLASRLACRPRYISTIAMPVEGFDVGFFRKKIYRFFDHFSERFVDRFLVVSDTLKNKMINERNIPAEKVIRVYNGIETDHYSPTRRIRERVRSEFNIGEEQTLVGSVGRLVWQKGFEYLIRSIPQILSVDPKAQVLVVGDGPMRNELEELAERMKVGEHLIIAGFRTDIKEILSGLDILVIPSLLEGFPMITLEGMAMAKPIIATKIDGITEQITHEESGIIIPPRDPQAIANAIIKVVNNARLAETMGLEARKRVENDFSVDRMVAETEKVYQTLSLPL
jgi:glycosyltransferase involved in cell wall biosynthesis